MKPPRPKLTIFFLLGMFLACSRASAPTNTDPSPKEKAISVDSPRLLQKGYPNFADIFEDVVPSVVSAYLAAVPRDAFPQEFRRIYISGEACSMERGGRNHRRHDDADAEHS